MTLSDPFGTQLEQWLSRRLSLCDSALPTRYGATARLGITVTETARGDLHYHLVFVDGRLVASALGSLSVNDASLTMTQAVHREYQRGQINMVDAILSGTVRIAGDLASLEAIAPVVDSPEWTMVLTEADRELLR